MSIRLKIKGVLLALVVLASVAIMGFTLVSMQDDLSIESAQADIQRAGICRCPAHRVEPWGTD